MFRWRIAGAAALILGGMAASPASAQFFFQSHDFRGQPVKGDEPGVVQPMPGATPAELRAGLTWTLRSALNVAALQCQFEPTLNSVETYNAILKDNDAEFDKAQATLQSYYARMPGAGNARAGRGSKPGQAGFDQFGTRTYSGFATVSAQFGFCQTASAIAREALFTPRGQFGDLAAARLRELRNSLTPYGEQQFPAYLVREAALTPLPSLDARCWSRKSEWTGKCGPQNWPPAGVGIAAR